MNFRKVALFTAVFALAVSVSGWAAAPCDGVQNLIYCQGFDGTGNAYSSQNDTVGFGLYAQVYDNFRVDADTIDSAHWVGEYFNPPQQGPITGWTVQLYNDAGGQPGSLKATFSFAGTGNETFLGNFGGFPTYSYGVDGLGWAVTPGTQYWLSVYPDLAFPPQWGWSSGTGGDGISYQDFFGARSQLAVDMAFGLDGKGGGGSTPEPGTLIMLGTGALGLAGAIRRKLF